MLNAALRGKPRRLFLRDSLYQIRLDYIRDKVDILLRTSTKNRRDESSVLGTKEKKNRLEVNRGAFFLFQHFNRTAIALHFVVRVLHSLPRPGNKGEWRRRTLQSGAVSERELRVERTHGCRLSRSQALKLQESHSTVTLTCPILEQLPSDLTDCHGIFHIKGKRGFGCTGKMI